MVLRHRPEVAGVQPDDHGWVLIDQLIQGSQGRLDRPVIEDVVATDGKRRFEISPDGKSIRASQGHSFPVDLELDPIKPPDFLYHGTYSGAIISILREGIKRMDRHHVHMAEEPESAESIGMRHGAGIVFRIDAKAMFESGHKFYRSKNGVWLTDHVPPLYLTRMR
jgi:putative RNA 2'-phosphotransferase